MAIDIKVYMALHGWYGAGKSSFILTGPGPRLVADVEGRILKSHLGGEKFLWKDRGKIKDKQDATCVKTINHPDDVKEWIEFLLSADHPFETTGFDSMTQYQIPLKRLVGAVDTKGTGGKARYGEYNPDDVFDQAAYGRMLNRHVMDLEDLKRINSAEFQHPVNVVITAATNREAPYARPELEGQIRRRLPGLPDIYGFLRPVVNPETGVEHRVMYIKGDDTKDAKCNLELVNEFWPKGAIIDPNFADIIAVANGRKPANK